MNCNGCCLYLNQTLTKHWQEFDRIKQALDDVNLNETATKVPADAKKLFTEVRKLHKTVESLPPVKGEEEDLVNLINNVDKLNLKMKLAVLKFKPNVTQGKRDLLENIDELKEGFSKAKELLPQAEEMYRRSLTKSGNNMQRNEDMTAIAKRAQKVDGDISTPVTEIKRDAAEVEKLCNKTCREVENFENDHLEFVANMEKFQDLIDSYKTINLIRNNFSEINATHVRAKSLKLPPFPNLTLPDYDYTKDVKMINEKNKNVRDRVSKSEDLIGKIKDHLDELKNVQKDVTFLEFLEFLDDLSSKLKE